MKNFFKYVYGRRYEILFYGLLVVFLTASFVLYRLEVRAVIYPCVCGALAGVGMLIVGFFRQRNRRKTLETCINSGILEPSELPLPSNETEEKYRELIAMLLDREAKAREKAGSDYNSMVDYYTLWVHQIKTPIASMRLKLQNEDTPLARWLRLDLSRIEAYVEMVLAYLRLDSPSSDYVIKEYDLDSLVRAGIKKFSGEFINRGLSLNYEPLNTKVLTDEKWLQFVFEQVLSNALKYTREGGISIYIEDGALCVKDTGIGIDPADLPRVFERGYTGSLGREDKRASGIGLFLCKRVCDALGHSISISSKEGSGTTVKIGLERKEFKYE
ncbi:MAG: sensor histidine kinase [Lachnospiraceae bacterium]|nr:sensor histidine kinase [Lachnospiraceae bacterium]